MCQGQFPTAGSDVTEYLYQAEKGEQNVIVVVRNSMAYPQTLRKKTPVMMAVEVTEVPEPLAPIGSMVAMREVKDNSLQMPK